MKNIHRLVAGGGKMKFSKGVGGYSFWTDIYVGHCKIKHWHRIVPYLLCPQFVLSILDLESGEVLQNVSSGHPLASVMVSKLLPDILSDFPTCKI